MLPSSLSRILCTLSLHLCFLCLERTATTTLQQLNHLCNKSKQHPNLYLILMLVSIVTTPKLPNLLNLHPSFPAIVHSTNKRSNCNSPFIPLQHLLSPFTLFSVTNNTKGSRLLLSPLESNLQHFSLFKFLFCNNTNIAAFFTLSLLPTSSTSIHRERASFFYLYPPLRQHQTIKGRTTRSATQRNYNPNRAFPPPQHSLPFFSTPPPYPHQTKQQTPSTIIAAAPKPFSSPSIQRANPLFYLAMHIGTTGGGAAQRTKRRDGEAGRGEVVVGDSTDGGGPAGRDLGRGGFHAGGGAESWWIWGWSGGGCDREQALEVAGWGALRWAVKGDPGTRICSGDARRGDAEEAARSATRGSSQHGGSGEGEMSHGAVGSLRAKGVGVDLAGRVEEGKDDGRWIRRRWRSGRGSRGSAWTGIARRRPPGSLAVEGMVVMEAARRSWRGG